METENKYEENKLDLYDIIYKTKKIDTYFYSPVFGDVSIVRSIPHEKEMVVSDGGMEYSLTPWGNLVGHNKGCCILFPSRELYEQYPLDARKAWQIWADEQKPKYNLHCKLFIGEDGDLSHCYVNETHQFSTKEDAEYAAQAVKKCLERVQEELNRKEMSK